MPDKTDAGGQPTMEKLEAEGVSLRKCISYEGSGEYGGKSSAPKTAKQVPATSSSPPMRSGRGGY